MSGLILGVRSKTTCVEERLKLYPPHPLSNVDRKNKLIQLIGTMEVLDTVRAVLAQKGSEIWSVTPDVTVYNAIALMAERNIGAVLVMEDQCLLGLLSERDYTRKVILKGKQSKETKVGDIMSIDVTTVSPLDTVEHCMRLMTQKRMRHLPVLDQDKVVGVVSIGNLVNWIISAQSAAIDQMERYIGSEYPG